MEAWLVSTATVALAEIGDKTQILAFILAAKYRKPVPIVLGILVATLANHGLAGGLGVWINARLGPDTLRWILGTVFIATGVWALIPDKVDENDAGRARDGVFVTTLVVFFLAEMADKTQVATVALAARFDALIAVVAGTTLGMMIANAPAVFAGGRLAGRVPVRAAHLVAAAVFVALGIATLYGAGNGLNTP